MKCQGHQKCHILKCHNFDSESNAEPPMWLKHLVAKIFAKNHSTKLGLSPLRRMHQTKINSTKDPGWSVNQEWYTACIVTDCTKNRYHYVMPSF